GEEPRRRIEIDLDLALEPLAQQRRTLVVNAAPPHIERFDLMGRRIADRLEIAFADQKIILDDATERRQRKHDATVRFAVVEPYVEDEAVLFDAEHQTVRTAARPARSETVVLEQIVDGDLALLLDLARASHQ